MKIDLEAIKNSKGYEFADNSHGKLCRLVPIEEAQQQDKQLKALEIIKNKKVDLAYFYRLQPRNDFSDNQKFKYINQYNEYGKKLTRKEYDLLKEILL